MVFVIVAIAVVIVIIAVLAAGVKIVRPYQRGLVERLGKYKTTEEPGLRLIMPFVETMQLIDAEAARLQEWLGTTRVRMSFPPPLGRSTRE